MEVRFNPAVLGGCFFFGALFVNGLGGSALLGTLMIAFIAVWKRNHASGPSIISAWGFIAFLIS
jgi:hypothetical protein